ncbi:hypothetical protein HN018_06770 [Lichenicola cladoniae]|uniref:Uncharacterized protein n=1 Tax=Lichenicola cladoniae TaxID=1484109 RepID=A0A6M8HMY4_9PROT|nr:hypothetical protein [Lichenicola cladoniae]NPD67275.1 hypothetical protein [Acetobacteraceae bacterium]QKE89779.1 hypothetical protein HN018_06770 [Lichenicola cladoniae]
MEYTVAAIPTTYNGRRYRSRLEAKWAAFFDLLKWSAEYEPFDLGKWSPDFQIYSPESRGLIEVKPWVNQSIETCDRVVEACCRHGFDDFGDYAWLTNVAPTFESSFAHVGWIANLREDDKTWTPVHIGWFRSPDEKHVSADLVHVSSDYWVSWMRADANRMGLDDEPMPQTDLVKSLWSRASNVCQWHAKATIT